MNQTVTQPPTTLERKTLDQASTNIPFFSDLPPLETSTIPTFTELLAEYQATVSKPAVAWNNLNLDQLADPFAIYQANLANATPQAVRWLWQKRLPLASVTLLDGDHGCGKSLLALQIAACVSSGTSMPDGTPTLQGGVVIVTPNRDATTTQLQLLTDMQADLPRIEILSYVHDPENSSHPSGYRPFSLPEDLPRLFESVERINARIIIFDPFIDLLSNSQRWTDQRLGSLLADLNQHLMERNIACLLVRNCPAKGGHARPSVLERSERFLRIAASRMLLAPDPINPHHLLLSHANSAPHTPLTPTLILQIQSHPHVPSIATMTFHGSHTLSARDFLTHRPEGLHRRLLSQHLLKLITATTDPTPVASLYASSPHSSPSQIQRALRDLLNMGQIDRPARGFYAPAPPTTPVPSFKSGTATSPNSQPAGELKSTGATSPISPPANKLKSRAVTSPSPQPTNELKSRAATSPISPPANELKSTGATSPISPPANELKSTGATSPISPPANELKSGAATSPNSQAAKELKSTGATSPNSQATNELKSTGATSPHSQPPRVAQRA
jgi:AAA domain